MLDHDSEPHPQASAVDSELAAQHQFKLGVIFAVGSHMLWGVFPIFWKSLRSVDSLQLVLHRVLWSLLFLTIMILILSRRKSPKHRKKLLAQLRTPKLWMLHGIAGVFVTANWLAFIWAVNHDQVLEASLGYYINPLLNVLLGVIVLGERLQRRQWIAIGIVFIGVAIMTAATGRLPLVSMVMAGTFAIYALIKKWTPVAALPGLAMEMTVLAPFAAVALYIQHQNGEGAMGNVSLQTDLLIVAGGIITIAPLTLFAAALQRVGMTMMGVLQYVGPTLQFLVGVFIYDEPLSLMRLVGFGFVWAAIALYLSTPRWRCP